MAQYVSNVLTCHKIEKIIILLPTSYGQSTYFDSIIPKTSTHNFTLWVVLLKNRMFILLGLETKIRI